MNSNTPTLNFIHLREIVSERNLFSVSEPHEALAFPESVSDPVGLYPLLFPVLGHPYCNNGPAMPNIGIFRCPNKL